MWDLSSQARDWTRVSCIERQILNHWTTREVQSPLIVVLSCISLMASDVKHLFMFLVALFYDFEKNTLFRSFVHFLIRFFSSWKISVQVLWQLFNWIYFASELYMFLFGILTPYQIIWFTNISSYSVSCLFWGPSEDTWTQKPSPWSLWSSFHVSQDLSESLYSSWN